MSVTLEDFIEQLKKKNDYYIPPEDYFDAEKGSLLLGINALGFYQELFPLDKNSRLYQSLKKYEHAEAIKWRSWLPYRFSLVKNLSEGYYVSRNSNDYLDFSQLVKLPSGLIVHQDVAISLNQKGITLPETQIDYKVINCKYFLF